MRSSLLATIVLSLAVLAPATAPAQVSPFSIRGAGESPPAERSRADERNATEAAPPIVPPNVNVAPAGPVVPPPFDINGDGRAPQVAVKPAEEQTLFPPATTVSPLGDGRPIRVVPVDATNSAERAGLSRLLKAESDTVRELRVALAEDGDWVDPVVDRPIVPYRTLRLDGEIDYAAWNFFVSAAEAARGGNLSIAFTNSVLVLPEASRLLIFLNGQQIAQTAIDSPERTKVVTLPITPGLLRPGENALRIEAEMRHRIDCSLDATYELWTRIDPRLTGFSFPGGRLTLAGLNDLPGVGVSSNGATRIRVLQHGPQSIASIDRLLRAVQSAALRGHFEQPLVEVSDLTRAPAPAPGTLNLVIGTYEQIRRAMPNVPSEAEVAPLTTLVDTASLGPTVFIAGPDERAVESALDQFAVPEAGDASTSPLAAPPPWLVPQSIAVDGADTVTLREAGIETINFSGRRFMTHFKVTLPPDFYAAAYGEATFYLDAAYAGEVQPGSNLQIFVNGVQSTVLNFTARDGQVFEDLPIALGMQNFRPGVNTIEIVANLETKADAMCLPGGTVPSRDRFALFSTSRLVFPAFARIGQLPNLASFAANGFPYPLSGEPVRVRVGSDSLDTVGAAGTLMARIAVSRGAALATMVVEQANAFTDAGVIIVAPLQETSSLALETTGTVIPSSWRQPFPPSGERGEPEGLDRYDAVLRRLRQQLRQEDVGLDRTAAAPGGPEVPSATATDQRSETERARERWFADLENNRQGIGGLLADGVRSIRETLDIGGRFGRQPLPSGSTGSVPEVATLLLSQARAPQNEKTAWTLVTAPTASLLSTSMAAISAPDNWDRIGGRLTAYVLEKNQIETIASDHISYIATLPLSFENMRLIAANWFSINDGVYAIVLVLVATALGVVTWLLVTRIGRTN